MSFSYKDSLAPWSPATSERDAKIRILDLQPIPWYLRWLPRYLTFFITLHATLKWIPLAPRRVSDLNEDRQARQKHTAWPAYKTLSYAWTGNPATHCIVVNGKNQTITASLADALLHLRPTSKALAIWVDQICIDQTNDLEKAEQVGFMDRIYRNTEEVLIWLGRAANGSDQVMDIFQKIGSFAEEEDFLSYYTKARYHLLNELYWNTIPDDPKTKAYHTFCESMVPLFDRSFFVALIALYSRPYLTRTWTIQEFSLPPKATVTCGYCSIQAETMMMVEQIYSLTIISKIIAASVGDQALLSLLDQVTTMNTFHPFFASRQRRKKWDEGEAEGDSLYHLLQRTHVDQGFQATNGCDMVYGLLGLARDVKELGIKADYGQGDDPQSQVALTYIRTAKAILASGQADLLIYSQHLKKDVRLPSWVPDWRSAIRRSFASANSSKDFDIVATSIAKVIQDNNILPSWVPDWRQEIQKSFCWLPDEASPPLFNASASQRIEIYPTDDERTLVISGYIVDTIEEVGGLWAGTATASGAGVSFPHEELLTYLAQIRHMCRLSKAREAPVYRDAVRRDEAHWRVPVGDLMQDRSHDTYRATKAFENGYKHCMAQLEMQAQADAMTSLTEYNEVVAEVAAMITADENGDGKRKSTGSEYRLRMQEMKNKRPFISSLGYVGMGPAFSRAQDMVVVLNGATVPFVVRPVEGGHRLLGEAYCDGIMDGEIVEMREKVQIVLV